MYTRQKTLRAACAAPGSSSIVLKLQPHVSPASARHCAPGHRAGTRCKAPSPPSTPRPTFDDTDWIGSSACTTCSLPGSHHWSSPLNRAVAVGFAHGPAAGLAALDELAAEPQLAQYPYLAAA